ncbi:hypothetical protein GCM10009745_01680 [Kribbella yunnanensis]|uniref:Uncharacterized protein n=1 Tax=Kribbella yunnanensis TaxID=190194 RepID=A0ABP4S3B7_9ACTN
MTDAPIYPVLLGPIRIETKWTKDHLLVRFFPDEWSIDKFEDKPAEAELSAVDAYWTAIWRAAGNAAAEQTAWHELTSRIAIGRAGWLISEHPPANPGDRPTAPADTAVLVVTSAAALPAADRQPTVNYWTAIWQAKGDRQKILAADLALFTAVGGRADAIRKRRPLGLDSITDDTAVLVAFLVFPVRPAELAKASWTKKAQARLLPDKFLVLGWENGEEVINKVGEPITGDLAVSPDPELPRAEQLEIDKTSGALRVPEDLQWLTNFEVAVRKGMGVKIDRTPKVTKGVSRLIVIGLRTKNGPAGSAQELADLISRQHRSTDGFVLLPQGTPTNNTEQAPAGQAKREAAETSLRTAFGLPEAVGDWKTKTDGEWFTELLGIDPAGLTGVPNFDGRDQAEARAANLALWPATWGSYLQTTLADAVPATVVEETRTFFTRYVSGRGAIPAFKVGRQPYGVLPTTVFSKLAWAANPHRTGLHAMLQTMAGDWTAAATANVKTVNSPGDRHQVLLDILALHPASAEFHQRYANSVDDLFNRRNLGNQGQLVVDRLRDTVLLEPPIRALFERLGHAGLNPDILRRLFVGEQFPLLGPLVTEGPLSEKDPIGPENYLAWLAANVRTDLDRIRREDGLVKKPAALLYLLLRHAVLLGWEEAARLLYAATGREPLPTADPAFVHVDANLASASRFRLLYSKDSAITSDPNRYVVDYIPTALTDGKPATARLAEQAAALDVLADLPTARLERLLAEHLDTATYRLDAWRLGLVNERLEEVRATGARGVHLGAYGWLDEVRPRKDAPTEKTDLTGKLKEIFQPAGSTPLLLEKGNGGYIHAPSPSHATTAAVLRAGYLANAAEETPTVFAVNLSSERVRVALSLLDGLRQGQSPGALLGYRFERALHDRYDGVPRVELDKYIDPLRSWFPLRSGKIDETSPVPGTAVEVVEARNVIDGLKLIQHVARPGRDPLQYPFGLPGLPPAGPDETKAIADAVDDLFDVHDAIGDLIVAEGTHQTLLGNTERAAATLDAVSKEGFPPEPAVVQSPRSGVSLTHRLAVRLTSGLSPNHGSTLFRGNGPRAKAEPAVNAWVAKMLPSQQDVVVVVSWREHGRPEPVKRTITQYDLELQPIDLFWALRPEDEAAMTDLDDRIAGVVAKLYRPRPDSELKIEYTTRVEDKVTFFELSPLVDALRTLLTTARPLRTTDLVPGAGSSTIDRTADLVVSLDKDRPLAVRDAMTEFLDQVKDLVGDLGSLFPADPAEPLRAEILEEVDALLAKHADLIVTAGSFGMVRSGWGELTAWRRGLFTDLLVAADVAADRLGATLGVADQLLHDYDQLPSGTPDEDRFRLLQQIENLLVTVPMKERPRTPRLYRLQLTIKRDEFNDKVEELAGIAASRETTVSGLYADIAAIELADVDPVGLDLTPYGDRVVAFVADLFERTKKLKTDLELRLANVVPILKAYDDAVLAPDRVEAGIDALKALLGEDVLVVPEFTPPSALADEWRKARNDSSRLVSHLARDYPVEDWLHGMARVREKPRLWEQVITLSDVLRKPKLLDLILPEERPLIPVQFPYRREDPWLALEFPPAFEINEDRLLFTAHYDDDPLLGRASQCGLLLDEWTEVLPATEETTGLAFHYDRPDSEPPQAMLLVVPPAQEALSVADLVAAINDTYDLAKSRAVEPVHLDGTAYAHLLPATVLSAADPAATIGTDLGTNNVRWRTDG